MGFRSIVSLGLFVVPIGVTLGLLLGIDAQRKSTGQQPLFVDNSVTVTSYCQKSYGISPPSYGQSYTLNPNQWNWQEGDPGKLCMKVHQYNNATYDTKYAAPPFSVTWQYPQGPETAPVHAFPNIKLDGEGSVFPTRVQDIANLKVEIEWSYGLGRTKVKNTDIEALVASNVNANVAIDMFLDSDKTRSESSIDAKYEIMVWLAMIGPSTEPIGFKKGPLTSLAINGTTFELYHGKNSLNQWVLTWVAGTAVETFVGDIAPLVTGIEQIAQLATNLPTSNDYLGYMGLGSETYWSPQYVTFAVPHLSMKVN